jgi:3-mercaptopyruvate sulfurtransferase SseA
MDQGYAHPEKLVTRSGSRSTSTIRGVRIVESNEDSCSTRGHIPGAVQIDWVGT